MKNKETLDDLAVFGAPPLFEDKLHVGRPNIGARKRILKSMNDILDRRWLTNSGPYVEEFEKLLSEYIGVKHCIAVCNATIGLQIAIRAVDLSGEVIVPSFTFIASAHALQWFGIKPVFCDIDRSSHNLDPDQVESLISPKTTGIMGVHVWGRPCEIERLAEIANKYNLQLVFDAAHALGCSYQGKMIGNYGSVEVFSFHATKFFNTFEGGAIATNDDELAEKIRLMKNFGFAGRDEVVSIGTNGKMSEISAAMGIVGLEHLEEFVAVNQRNYQAYKRIFEDLPGINLITYDETEKQNYQYIIVEIDEQMTGINRDMLVDLLSAENILARRYFYPGCHQMEPYRTLYPESKAKLSQTEKLSQIVMSLPNGTAIDLDDIQKVGQIIQFIIEHSDEIKSKYAQL